MKLEKRKYASLVIAALIIIILISTQFPQLSTALKTTGVYINIIFREVKLRPLDVFTKEPIFEEHVIKSTNERRLRAHLFLPAGKNRHRALLIYTPLIRKGLDDPRLINIAKTFARAGFVTIVPQKEKNRLIIEPQDIEDVISSTLFLKNHPRVKPKGIGLFGLSFGNGPVIWAAEDERIRDSVGFILSFSGYYDLKNVLRFVATGGYEYQEINQTFEPDPYVRELLELNLKHYQINSDTVRKLMGEPDKFDQILTEIPQLEKLRISLSPSNIVPDLRVKFFIIHSIGDNLIPYTESMRLHDEVKDKMPTRFTLIHIFQHGKFGNLLFPTPKNIYKHYLPSIRDSYLFLYSLLAEEGR